MRIALYELDGARDKIPKLLLLNFEEPVNVTRRRASADGLIDDASCKHQFLYAKVLI